MKSNLIKLSKKEKEKFGNTFIGYKWIKFRDKKIKKYIPNEEIGDDIDYLLNNI